MLGADYVGALFISTVFIGVDHSWGEGEPLIFETMVFGEGSCDEKYMERYSNWSDAEEGHKRIVEMVKSESDRKSENLSPKSESNPKSEENTNGGGDDLT